MFWDAYREANQTDSVSLMRPRTAGRWIREIESEIDCPELIGFLREWPFAESAQLCAHYFYSPREMVKETRAHTALRDRFFAVGCAANGDFIVIPKACQSEVGFVDHETLDDKLGVCKYVAVAKSIGEIYFNSWHKQGYPGDYYEAIKQEGTPNQAL